MSYLCFTHEENVNVTHPTKQLPKRDAPAMQENELPDIDAENENAHPGPDTSSKGAVEPAKVAPNQLHSVSPRKALVPIDK